MLKKKNGSLLLGLRLFSRRAGQARGVGPSRRLPFFFFYYSVIFDATGFRVDYNTATAKLGIHRVYISVYIIYCVPYLKENVLS